MTLNPIRWWKNRGKHKRALKGHASSGHLDTSERSAAFQNVKKLPK